MFRFFATIRLLLAALTSMACAGILCAQEKVPTAADWSSALPGWLYRFPDDHAWHPDYKTEWWYFTGNLQDARGKSYGYELTFFRQGTLPPARLATLFTAGQPRSRFIQGDFKFAHFAISDLDGRHFYFTERTTRGAFGEAGFGPAPSNDPAAANEPLARLEDWQLVPLKDGAWQITARSQTPTPMSIDLRLQPTLPPVIHGAEGVSQKAAGLGNASHYYSFTRLETLGRLTVGEGTDSLLVHGDSWFDHEWASNQLAGDQVGWDWFCFQFDDGTELMLYAMRRRDGSVDPVSAGTFVDGGQTTHLSRTDFKLEPGRTWKSKATEATYPLAWTVSIPGLQLAFTLEPALDDQELVLPPISYWEGAIRVKGQRAGQAITGKGYMELTGYAGALKGLQKTNSPEEDLRLAPR